MRISAGTRVPANAGCVRTRAFRPTFRIYGYERGASLRQVLISLDRMAQISQKAKRGLRVLKSFFDGLKLEYHDIEIGIDVDPEPGIADSGARSGWIFAYRRSHQGHDRLGRLQHLPTAILLSPCRVCGLYEANYAGQSMGAGLAQAPRRCASQT
jgi:hypothetical protein